MKYRLAAVGGTFDRLHQGHKDFLNFTIHLGEKVILGLTSNTYIQKYKDGLGVESFEVRNRELEIYLDSIQKRDQVEIISLDDHFGPTLSNEYPFDSLAVTTSTEEMGATINTKRQEQGMQPFPLEVFKLTLAQDGKPITSTRIRNGEIDREGKLYLKKEWLDRSLALPLDLRAELAKPLGEIIQEIPSGLDSNKIITVGDATTKRFIEANVNPILSIIDHKVERKSVQEEEFHFPKTVSVVSAAGVITPELFDAIYGLLKNKERALITVEGEEDLATLPAILSAPLGYQIFYGQPHQGMVQVIVSEEMKNKIRILLDRFEII